MERLPLPVDDEEFRPAAVRPLETRRRRRRLPRVGPRFQLALLVLTLVTLAFAGGLTWEVGDSTDPAPTDAVQALPPEGAAWVMTRAAQVAGIIARGAVYAFWVFVILGAHEMGHYLACRYYRIPATLPFFIPGPPPLGSFGAVIRIRGLIPSRKALFDVAAAGPIAGFALALPVLIVGLLRAEPVAALEAGETGFSIGEPGILLLFGRLLVDPDQAVWVSSLFGAGWVGMLVTSLNLFPVGQLDGGHAAYALSRRTHRIASRVTLFGMAGLLGIQMVVYGQFPAYLLWFGILLWMRDRHPRLLDESTPLGLGRKLVAVLLLLMFLGSFIPVPFMIAG